jgi:hypothetical protein
LEYKDGELTKASMAISFVGGLDDKLLGEVSDLAHGVVDSINIESINVGPLPNLPIPGISGGGS